MKIVNRDGFLSKSLPPHMCPNSPTRAQLQISRIVILVDLTCGYRNSGTSSSRFSKSSEVRKGTEDTESGTACQLLLLFAPRRFYAVTEHVPLASLFLGGPTYWDAKHTTTNATALGIWEGSVKTNTTVLRVFTVLQCARSEKRNTGVFKD